MDFFAEPPHGGDRWNDFTGAPFFEHHPPALRSEPASPSPFMCPRVLRLEARDQPRECAG